MTINSGYSSALRLRYIRRLIPCRGRYKISRNKIRLNN